MDVEKTESDLEKEAIALPGWLRSIRSLES